MQDQQNQDTMKANIVAINDEATVSAQSPRKVSWIRSFFVRFDHSFLAVFFLNYAAVGNLVFLQLMMKDLYKNYLNAGPGEFQYASSFLMLPWSIKLFYGLLSDNFPINGYKRKNYLVMNGLIGFVSLALLVPSSLFSTIEVVTVFLFFAMIATAWTDVLADSLMVVESRKDTVRGSEDFQTLIFLIFSTFGIIGAVAGAYFTEYLNPRFGLLLFSMYGLFGSIGALKLQEKKVKLDQGKCHHLKSQLSKMGQAFKSPIIYKVCIYQVVTGAIVPRFQEFKYYYLTEEIGMSEFAYGLLYIGSCVSLLLVTALFHWILGKFSYRQAMASAILLTSITTFFDLLFVLKVYDYIGINKYVFLVFTNMFEDFLGFKFSIICNGVIHTRITPHSVEATVLSVLGGMSNFGFGVLGPITGNIWASQLGIDKNNLQNLYLGLFVKFVMSFVPLLFLRLLPNKEEIENDKDLASLNAVLEKDESLLDNQLEEGNTSKEKL